MNDNEIAIINSLGLNGSLGKKPQLKKFIFRLAGAPPDRAIRLIHVDKNHSLSELKHIVIREYKLNPILDIQFICNRRILVNNIHHHLSKNPANAEILVMLVLSGG